MPLLHYCTGEYQFILDESIDNPESNKIGSGCHITKIDNEFIEEKTKAEIIKVYITPSGGITLVTVEQCGEVTASPK